MIPEVEKVFCVSAGGALTLLMIENT